MGQSHSHHWKAKNQIFLGFINQSVFDDTVSSTIVLYLVQFNFLKINILLLAILVVGPLHVQLIANYFEGSSSLKTWSVRLVFKNFCVLHRALTSKVLKVWQWCSTPLTYWSITQSFTIAPNNNINQVSRSSEISKLGITSSSKCKKRRLRTLTYNTSKISKKTKDKSSIPLSIKP